MLKNKKIRLMFLFFAFVLISCDYLQNETKEEKAYSDTRQWLNKFINSTSLQKDNMLTNVRTNPQNWCGKVKNVKQINSNEYEISLDFGSYDIGAPMIEMTTHNKNTAGSAEKGKYFMAINRGAVTYFHYIYHTIMFEID
jgi:hypothetical protein